MAILKQSMAFTRMFLMVDSTDHVTGKTGLTVTVTLSKAGAAYAAAGGTITEVANGLYKIAFTTTDTNTLGDLAIHCTGTAADPCDFIDQVSANLLDDISGRIPTALGANGNIKADVRDYNGAAGTFAAGRPEVNATHAAGVAWASGAITAAVLADACIDRATFAADTGLQTARSNTATAGAAGTVTLDAGASVSVDFFKDCIIYITGGTGVGQSRVITGYSSGRVASVSPNWITNPDNTSTYAILPSSLINSIIGAVGSVTGNLGGNVTGSVGSIATGGIVAASFAAGAIDAAAVATDAIGSAELATSAVQEIADALLDRADAVETGMTVRQALRAMASALAAKISGAGTVTEVFRNAVADSKDRLTATVDASGNRTGITYDLT